MQYNAMHKFVGILDNIAEPSFGLIADKNC